MSLAAERCAFVVVDVPVVFELYVGTVVSRSELERAWIQQLQSQEAR